MAGKTFQQLLIPQPIKLGGLGLRSMVETSPAAFIGGVEMSLPHFTGVGGILPILEGVIGIIEGGTRWSSFLTQESRTSREFKDAWLALRSEAAQYTSSLVRSWRVP